MTTLIEITFEVTNADGEPVTVTVTPEELVRLTDELNELRTQAIEDVV